MLPAQPDRRVRPELPVRVLTAVAVRVRAVALTEVAVVAAPAPIVAAAEAVEAAVLPPAAVEDDADKQKG